MELVELSTHLGAERVYLKTKKVIEFSQSIIV